MKSKPKPAMTPINLTKKVGFCLLFSLAMIFSACSAYSQCEIGETEMTISIQTDNWGYETYWELRPEGAPCGENIIVSGGNLDQVGCTGGGEQDAIGGNGYANNVIIEVDPFCVVIGEPLELQFVDDWGDGGLTFTIFEDGQFTGSYVGGGNGVTWIFTPGESGLPIYDMPCGALEVEVNGDPLSMNNEAAAVFPGEVTPGGGNCALYGIWCEGGLSNTIWATFVAPEGEAMFISTCNEGTTFDTQLAVWTADDCTDFDSFDLVSSNDDIIGGCGIANGYASGCYVSCLNPGQTYYIQIDGWNAATGDVLLTVETYEGETSMGAFVNNIPCALDKGEDGNGNISLYVTGTGADFDAVWTGPNGFSESTSSIADLSAGDYSVVVTDNCGNEFTDSWTIFSPTAMGVSVVIENPACPLSINGSISVIATGGTGGFEYEWTGPNEYTSIEPAPNDISEGAYTVVVSDENGCEYIQNINIVSDNDVDLNLGLDGIICIDETIILSGPIGYSYEWQDGSENQFFQVNAEELGLGSYTFVLSVENEEGCAATDAINLTVDECVGVYGQNELEIAVFPIPADANLNLNGMPEGEKTVQIFDMQGKRIVNLQTTNVNHTLDVAELKAGMYTLSVFTRTGVLLNKKIVIE
ncbi:MAG: hypothetical protein ACJAU0_001092 [Flavobacteriales bacterium]